MKKILTGVLAIVFLAGTTFAQTQKATVKEAPKATQNAPVKKEAPKPVEMTKEVQTEKQAMTHKKGMKMSKRESKMAPKPATPAPAPKK